MQGYRYQAARIAKHIGGIPLRKLGEEDVRYLLNRMSHYRLRVRSDAYYFLRQALDYAVNKRYLDANPARLVGTPRGEEEPLARSFETDEAVRWVAGVRGHRLEGIFLFAVLLGMRIGEILGLRWSDIDIARRKLMVSNQRLSLAGPTQFGAPKGKHGRREIPLPGRLVEVLEARRRAQELQRQLAGDRWVESDLVFTTAHGTAFHPPNVRREMKKLLRDLGCLRSASTTNGTRWRLCLPQPARKGVVKDLMGHGDVRTTKNVYTYAFHTPRSRMQSPRWGNC